MAEYQTLATAAQYDRWATLLHTSNLSTEDADRVLVADAFGAFATELREAEADGHHPRQLLHQITNGVRGLGDADDPAAVLHHRLTHTLTKTDTPRRSGKRSTRQPPTRRATGSPRTGGARRIAGLIAPATASDAEMRQALEQRAQLIEQRAHNTLDTALRERAGWAARLGPAPTGAQQHQAWTRAAVTVAAYLELYADADGSAAPRHTKLRDTATITAQDLARKRHDAGAAAAPGRSGPSL